MVSKPMEQHFLARIQDALAVAGDVARHLTVPALLNGSREATIKDAERKLSDALRQVLLQPGEGWLCEEDADDLARLACDIVWVIDPVDGTQEFITGVPEWSISVGLVAEGTALAGGIFNPMTAELVMGSRSCGVTYNGAPAQAATNTSLDGAVVLASRQEINRGEWQRFQNCGFVVRPTGSVAYKLALVAAGLADATWTLCPKNEWDVAAGVALVNAAGGQVGFLGGGPVLFNRQQTLLPGLIATSGALWETVGHLLSESAPPPSSSSRGSHAQSAPSARQG